MAGPRGEIADVGTVFLPYPLGPRYRPLLTRLRLPVRAAAHSRRLNADFRVPIMATAPATRLGAQFMKESAIAKQFGLVDKDQQRAMGGREFVRGAGRDHHAGASHALSMITARSDPITGPLYVMAITLARSRLWHLPTGRR
jgi:hypothetical protein